MKEIPRNWQDSFLWMIYNLGGMLLPVIFSVIILLGLKSNCSLGSVTDGGQFAIYSIGMMISTLYFVAKPDPKRLSFTEFYVIICFVAILISLALFVLAILNSSGVPVDKNFIQWPTVGLFIVCSIITLFAVNEDCKRAEITQNELQNVTKFAQDSLEKDFDRKYHE